MGGRLLSVSPFPLGLECPEVVELLEAEGLEQADRRPPITLDGLTMLHDRCRGARAPRGREAQGRPEQGAAYPPASLSRLDVDPPDHATAFPAKGDLGHGDVLLGRPDRQPPGRNLAWP